MMESCKDNKLRSRRRMVLLDEEVGFFGLSHGHFRFRRSAPSQVLLSSWNLLDDAPDFCQPLLDRVPHQLAIIQIRHSLSMNISLLWNPAFVATSMCSTS